MKTNQCELILQYLKDFGSITTYQSFIDLGITRLSSRIWDLKQQGYSFTEEWVSKKNRYGKSIVFKKYTLEESIQYAVKTVNSILKNARKKQLTKKV